MRRISLLLTAFMCVLAVPAAEAVDTTWHETLALGPTDVTDLAAREGLVLAGGREALDDRGNVLPGPRLRGLYRSTDSGRSWTRAMQETGDEPAVIDRTPDLLAMGRSGPAYALFGRDVWRSDDDAMLWREVGTVPDAVSVMAVLDDGRVVAGQEAGGAIVTSDDGASWQPLGTGLPSARVHDILAAGPALLVATDDGVFRSTDGGATFTRSALGLHAQDAPALALARGAAGVFLAAASPWEPSHGVVYRSEDGGATWVPASLVVRHPVPSVMPGALEVAVHATPSGDAEVLYAGTTAGLYRASVDTPAPGGISASVNGVAWERVQPEPGSVRVGALAVEDVRPGPSREEVVHTAVPFASPFVAGADERLAAPGWYDGRNPIYGECGGLVVTPEETIYAACGAHVLRSDDGGATWRGTGDGLPHDQVIPGWDPLARAADGSLWTGTHHLGLWRSDPDVEEWSRVPFPGASLYDLEAHPTDPRTIYAAGLATNGTLPVLWRTTDGGTTWTPVLEPQAAVSAIAVSPLQPDRVFVASPSGGWLSTDRGSTWVRSTVAGGGLREAAFSEVDPEIGWGRGNPPGMDLMRTRDGGETWTSLGPVPFHGNWVPYPSPWDTDTVYFSTSGGAGVYVTRDAGDSFQAFGSGLATFNGFIWTEHVAFSAADRGRLYAVSTIYAGGSHNVRHGWPYTALDTAAP